MKNFFKSKKLLLFSLLVLFLIPISILSISMGVMKSSQKYIHKEENITIENEKKYDAILVLGSGVRGNSPTPILKERLETGISLYKNGIAPKIIMSGDHGKKYYDEVNIMKDYAIKQDIPSEDIFMDHAGFSTYESMYRAGYIFNVKRMVVVSQEYHLYRAIYIAKRLNIDVIGANATKSIMSGHSARLTREIFAQNKDFFKVILKPKPTFLGEKISLEGSGDVTNDRE